MDLRYECVQSHCSIKHFSINGIDADINDFGMQYDRDPLPCGCGNMEFTRIPSYEPVLHKYKIKEAEYNEICNKLEEDLSFGECDLCEGEGPQHG